MTQLCLYTGVEIPDEPAPIDTLALLEAEAAYERDQGRIFAAQAIERVVRKIKGAVLE